MAKIKFFSGKFEKPKKRRKGVTFQKCFQRSKQIQKESRGQGKEDK